ncbi:metal ABC transporter solute-binding protein, Zn/Mn family [uncultured Helicobacter sp.]|uniref:metal ABC transporter solute-binding protein, Zn/Mn family n=1 Tax=uncultured Helicobacter sp. TaxID=175537 RepID=UPI00375023DE
MRYLFVLGILLSVAQAKVMVMVSVLPQSYLVQKIAKDYADVKVMVPKGKSPELYEPLPLQMRDVKESHIYVGVGMPFEKKWFRRFKSVNPKLRFVDVPRALTQSGFKVAHDPHIWLSPALMKIQAREIFHAIAGIDLKNKSFYKQNYESLLKEIDALDSEIQAIFAKPSAKKIFVVYHPAWGYFASDYGLQEVAIESEGKEAKSAHLQEVINTIKSNNIRTIFLQPQFSKKQVQALSNELGLKIIELDSLQEDWAEAMRAYARAIATQE